MVPFSTTLIPISSPIDIQLAGTHQSLDSNSVDQLPSDGTFLYNQRKITSVGDTSSNNFVSNTYQTSYLTTSRYY